MPSSNEACVRVRLEGSVPGAIQMLILPWATRPSRRSRDLEASRGRTELESSSSLPRLFLSSTREAMRFAEASNSGCRMRSTARSFPAFWLVCRAGNLLTAAAITCSRRPAVQDGVREDLQAGVVKAVAALGPVMRRDASNRTTNARFAEALTLVYRILFLLFAESRALAPLQHPRSGPSYALTPICRDAGWAPTGISACGTDSRRSLGCHGRDAIPPISWLSHSMAGCSREPRFPH